jgi:hypothetical protein
MTPLGGNVPLAEKRSTVACHSTLGKFIAIR